MHSHHELHELTHEQNAVRFTTVIRSLCHCMYAHAVLCCISSLWTVAAVYTSVARMKCIGCHMVGSTRRTSACLKRRLLACPSVPCDSSLCTLLFVYVATSWRLNEQGAAREPHTADHVQDTH
jgi:predicted nucleic acid binding AN1-type Zn finger protein